MTRRQYPGPICSCGWPERDCYAESQSDGDTVNHDRRIEAWEADEQLWRQLAERNKAVSP
jgi:hypothetical protein